jgi:hypothetical protein
MGLFMTKPFPSFTYTSSYHLIIRLEQYLYEQQKYDSVHKNETEDSKKVQRIKKPSSQLNVNFQL